MFFSGFVIYPKAVVRAISKHKLNMAQQSSQSRVRRWTLLRVLRCSTILDRLVIEVQLDPVEKRELY